MNIFDPRNYGANPNDNIDDTKAIQSALDAAKLAGGGKVILDAGTYIIKGTGTASDGALRIYSNTEITGEGMGKTILKLADGWSAKITGLIRTPVNEVTTDVIIRDLTLDGNRANSTADVDGIMTGVLPGKSEHDDRILIERVEIHDVSRIAFNPHEQTQNLIIRDSVAHHNSWDGFIADFVSNAIYENNVAYANDRHGFNVVTHSHDVILRNNVSYGNAENGIVVQRGAGSQTVEGWQDMLNRDILVEGNTVYNNGSNGILFKQAENSQVINNVIYGNGHDGIQLEGANEIIVDGNQILSSTIFGIEIRPYTGSLGGPGSSYDNTIINNVVTAVQKAFVETGSTTMNDTFAGNLIGTLGVSLVSSSTITGNSVSFVYDKIHLTVTLPQNYGTGNEETPPPPPPPIDPPPTQGVFLSGNEHDNTLTGTDYNDTLKGRSGYDKLYGGKGDDYIEGNEGGDIIAGGAGKDTMKGGVGFDTFVFSAFSEAGQGDVIQDFNVRADKLDLTDMMKSFVGFTKAKAFTDGFIKLVQNGENTEVYVDQDGLAGSGASKLLAVLDKTVVTSFRDTNYIMPDVGLPKPVPTTPDNQASPTPVTLSGTTGNDTLHGSNAVDTLKGNSGDDKLYGYAGNDSLWGNNGNDTLIGGKGSDVMKGGEGADLFGITVNGSDRDTIEDLRIHDGDRIQIDNILSFDKTTDAISNFVRLTTVGTDTVLSVDADGLANGSQFIAVATIKGVTGLNVDQLYLDNDLVLTQSSTV